MNIVVKADAAEVADLARESGNFGVRATLEHDVALLRAPSPRGPYPLHA